MTRPTTCPNCGEPLQEGASHCAGCGAVLPDAPDPSDGWEAVRLQLEEATRGEFEILRELGRGGMAAVYLARDLALGRNVAVKVMAPGLLMGQGMVDRFRQEAVTVANLHHPNIITIHTVRQAETLHFFVMELVDGGSLEDVLRRPEPVSVAVTQAILYQIGTGLAYAHRRGVVHRDIKPANVLLDGDGNAIVTDFGIAKVTSSANLTQTGLTIGTPKYMSPEQCLARELSGASDQYSLGVVAYEMLTGDPPFGGSPFEIMQAHASAPVPGIRERRPDCPPEIEAAVLRMLAKDPAERFPSVAEAIEAVGGYLPGPRDPLRAELARLVKPDTAVPTEVWSPMGPLSSRSPSPGPGLPTPARAPTWWQHPRLSFLLVGVLGLAGVSILAVMLIRGWPTRDAAPFDLEPATVASILFPNPAESLEVGTTARVRARLQDEMGGALAGIEVEWASDDSTVVAVEASDDEVVLRGLAPGTAVVQATAGGIRETFRAVVVTAPHEVEPAPEPARRDEVTPSPRVLALTVGQPPEPLLAGDFVTLRTVVAAEPPGYRGEEGVTWASSNPSVASVAVSGGDTAVVNLLAQGDATLTARAGEVRHSVTLRVRPASPTVALTLSRNSITFQAEEDGPAPPEQTVQARVTGDASPSLGAVDYLGGLEGWLVPLLGRVSEQEAVLTLRADVGGLTAGSHRARVPVEAGGQTRELEVRFEVAPRPVSVAVEPTPAAEREIGDLLSAYAGAINARNEARVRELYPSIRQEAIRDLLRLRESDLFQVSPLAGTLRAGDQAGTLDIDVMSGIIDDRTGRGETRRLTYTVGRDDRGWHVVGIR